MVLDLELEVLSFVRSQREGDLASYLHCLESLVPLFFSFDHTNYARWLPFHIFDLKKLPSSIQSHFNEGKCVISSTGRKFSTIPFDQIHETMNKTLKGAGGILGLTEDPVALK